TPYPSPNSESPNLISGETIEELAANIDERLAERGDLITGVRLDENFVESLKETIDRFNEFAVNGVDRDYQRESAPFSGGRLEGNDYPSGAMYPLSEKGPYYCVLTGPGVLGTNGGPKINIKSQVVNADNEPIPGL